MVAYATVLATDNFNRADDADLGADWDVVTAMAAFSISANTALPSAAQDSAESNVSVAWPPDQYALAKLTVVGTDGGGAGMGLHLRQVSGAKTFYRFVADHAASNNVTIGKFVLGIFTTLASFTEAWTNGDQWELHIQGNRISVFHGSTLVGAVTDGAITAGRCGIELSTTVTSGFLDDFEGGGFNGKAAANYLNFPRPMLRPSLSQGRVN